MADAKYIELIAAFMLKPCPDCGRHQPHECDRSVPTTAPVYAGTYADLVAVIAASPQLCAWLTAPLPAEPDACMGCGRSICRCW